MFPFDLQAKLAQTWFDAAASGFAALSALASPPRNHYSWLAPAAAMPMAGGIWGASNPWAWMTGASRGWWEMPMPFYANWSGPLGFGMAPNGWPSPYGTWAGMFRTATTPFSMFAPSPWQQGAPIVLPIAETTAVAVETIKLIEASYRTASGHATAAIFRAMEPPQTRALSRSH
jgi:hypothetical protein